MKYSLKHLCRLRFVAVVAAGLGVGWALTESLGPGSAYALGGALIAILLERDRAC